MTEKKSSGLFYGHVIVAVCFLVGVLSFGTLRSYGVFLEHFIKEFGWSRAAISGAFTMSFAVMGFLGIFAGRLSDRFNPRVIMTVSGLFLGTGFLLLSRTSAIWHLYLFYGLFMGIGTSAAMVPTMSVVTRWYVKRRGLVTGIVAAGPACGISIVPLIATGLIQSLGWRNCFLVIGAAVLVLYLTAVQLVRKDPAEIGKLPYGGTAAGMQQEMARSSQYSLRSVMRTAPFYLLCIISFAMFFNTNVIVNHIAIHARDLEFSPTLAAMVLALIGAVSIPGRITAGISADHIGNRPTIITGAVITTAAFLWLMVANELWMLYAFSIAFGLGAWAANSLMSTMIAELFGTKSHGTILGIIFFIGNLGGAGGPVLAGYIFDTAGTYRDVFLIGAALSITSIIGVLLLGAKTRKRVPARAIAMEEKNG